MNGGGGSAVRLEDKDDRRPPDSSLRAVWSISCCSICRFVDGIRGTNAVHSWQRGLRVTPVSETI